LYFIATSGVCLFPQGPLVFFFPKDNFRNNNNKTKQKPAAEPEV